MNRVQASGFFNEPGSLKNPEACTLFIFRRYPPFVKFGCPEEPPVLCQGNRGTAPGGNSGVVYILKLVDGIVRVVVLRCEGA